MTLAATKMNIDELSEKVYIDLNGRVASVDEDDEITIIRFKCDDWGDCDTERIIKLVCTGVVECELKPSMSGDIDFYEDHPLLWKYNNDHGYLYYSSESKNKYELIGRVWEAHEMTMNGWRPITKFINTFSSNSKIEFCSGKSGLLADGPRPLLEAYQQSVSGILETNYVPSYQRNGKLKALIFDHGFVICNSVSIEDETSS
jgi:hypothetical protein